MLGLLQLLSHGREVRSTQACLHGHSSHVERQWASEAIQSQTPSRFSLPLEYSGPQHLFTTFSRWVLTCETYVVWTTTQESAVKDRQGATRLSADDREGMDLCGLPGEEFTSRQSDKDLPLSVSCVWQVLPWAQHPCGTGRNSAPLYPQPSLSTAPLLCHCTGFTPPPGHYCCQVRKMGRQDTCFLLQSG